MKKMIKIQLKNILKVFAQASSHKDSENLIMELFAQKFNSIKINEDCFRVSDFMQHEIFNKYHSETEMMRYIKRLENKRFLIK